jgi:hypothetical protein
MMDDHTSCTWSTLEWVLLGGALALRQTIMGDMGQPLAMTLGGRHE